MKFITQDALDNAVLFKLFVHAQSSDKRLKNDEIAALFNIAISAKRVELAIFNLEAREYVSRWAQGGTSTIVSAGYRYVEEQLTKPNSFLRTYADAGDEWLQSQTVGIGGVPASDRVVSRSDNETAIREINETLGEIAGELNENNEVGDALGDEREIVLGEVEASQTLVGKRSFRLGRLMSLLMPVLKYLSDKFGSGAIADMARRLMQLLSDLI